jgi:hypothetical protein
MSAVTIEKTVIEASGRFPILAKRQFADLTEPQGSIT